jgi:hypothetical protein
MQKRVAHAPHYRYLQCAQQDNLGQSVAIALLPQPEDALSDIPPFDSEVIHMLYHHERFTTIHTAHELGRPAAKRSSGPSDNQSS